MVLDQDFTLSMDEHWQEVINSQESLDEDWDTGCHGFEYSSLFFLVLALIVMTFGIYGVLLFKRRNRNGGLLYGFDILYCTIFIFSLLRLAPVIWNNIQLIKPNYYETSQTACKMMAYTSIGTINVIGFLLIALALYAWIGVKSKAYSHSDIDRVLRRHLGWFVLFLFALEGVTGMAPAIYTDTGTDQACYPSLLTDQKQDEYLAYITILSFVLPYIIPFLAIIYPLIDSWRSMAAIDDDIYRSAVKTVVIVEISFIACYTPGTILSLVLYPFLLKGYDFDWNTVCGIENFCHFIQDSYYVVIPFVILLNDPELGRDFPGKLTAQKVFKKIRQWILGATMTKNSSTEISSAEDVA